MGYKNIISALFYMWLSLVFSLIFVPTTIAMESCRCDHKVLDQFVHNYAKKAVKRPHTGILYNITLPSNYSGVEVSYMRLKSGSLWKRGKSSSLFQIPTKILPSPYVKRLDIVFQNLGNLSSCYFNVPNYTFVAPVLGFKIYNGDTNQSSLNGSQMITISLSGDPIVVRFPSVSAKKSDTATMKCVRFGTIGAEIEFSNVSVPNMCIARDQGHFSIVVPSVLPTSTKKREKLWLWLVIGGGGFVFSILCGIFVFKIIRERKIESMEKESEKSEALDTIWIGKSKMPSASGIRTQPVLEDDYFP